MPTAIQEISAGDSVRIARLDQFLPTDDRNALYSAACAHRRAFQPLVPGMEENGSLFLPDDAERTQAVPIREAAASLTQGVKAVLPDLLKTLGLPSFSVERVPMNFIHGLDGHCGLPHADAVDGRLQVSLIYYFHRVPKVFEGGHLNFYATEPQSSTGHSQDPVLSIKQEDNLLVAFTSETYHGITDVRCESTDFADGRFAVVSFLSPNRSAG